MKKKLLLCALVSLTFSLAATAQQITGSVSDDNGIPLPGASIVIEGTSDGTTTNFDGNFTIDASQGSTLVISYVGYESQEIVVGSSPINVQLISDNALDEVVVTALGLTREKKSSIYLNLNPNLSILVPEGRYRLITEKLSKSNIRFLPSLSM